MFIPFYHHALRKNMAVKWETVPNQGTSTTSEAYFLTSARTCRWTAGAEMHKKNLLWEDHPGSKEHPKTWNRQSTYVIFCQLDLIIPGRMRNWSQINPYLNSETCHMCDIRVSSPSKESVEDHRSEWGYPWLSCIHMHSYTYINKLCMCIYL